MNNDIREQLAAYSHDTAWAGWMKYQFSKCILNPDNSMTIPAELVERWGRQAHVLYDDLSEQEKESDREQADFILKIIDPLWSDKEK